MRMYLFVTCFVTLFCLPDAVESTDQSAPPPSCHVTGDPHVLTFDGEKMALQIPCQYRVTQIVSPLVGTPNDGDVNEMVISVMATNGLKPVEGRFFVSDVYVDIRHKTINASVVTHFGAVGTGLDFISSARESGNWSKVWRVNSEPELQDLITTDYFPQKNLAVLTVGNYMRLSFRPVNPVGGIPQRPLPGLTVEVLADGMVQSFSSEFPQTLCSSQNANVTIAEHAVTWNISNNDVGILAVLKQNVVQPLGSYSQIRMCTSVNTEYVDCSDGDAAVKKCSFLLTRPRVVKCLEEVVGTSVLSLFDECLKDTCSGLNWACDDGDRFAVDCPEIKEECRA